MTIPKHVKVLLDSNPLRCACGNERREGFAVVEWQQVVVACCRECRRTYEYDRLDNRGLWKESRPMSQWIDLGMVWPEEIGEELG
jgi:hypothetical protein